MALGGMWGQQVGDVQRATGARHGWWVGDGWYVRDKREVGDEARRSGPGCGGVYGWWGPGGFLIDSISQVVFQARCQFCCSCENEVDYQGEWNLVPLLPLQLLPQAPYLQRSCGALSCCRRCSCRPCSCCNWRCLRRSVVAASATAAASLPRHLLILLAPLLVVLLLLLLQLPLLPLWALLP